MWLNPQFPADLVTFTEKFISYPNKKLPAQFQQQERQNQVEKTVKVYKDSRVTSTTSVWCLYRQPKLHLTLPSTRTTYFN